MSDADTVDMIAMQHALVDRLIEKGSLQDATVEAAFRAVPRHPFLPDKAPEIVYQDHAIPTRFDADGRAISSSSQPAIMAIMLEQLALQPGQHVLEIGAGTGYNAALMGWLVGKDGRVTTVDIDPGIVADAQAHLQAVGAANVTAVCQDGMEGYAPHAPYDRIILTVGGWDIPPAWLNQLKPDGRLLLPLSLNGPQFSIAFERQNGCLHSVSVQPCGFMRLRGPLAGPDRSLHLDPENEVLLGYEDAIYNPRQIEAEKIYAWFTGPFQDVATGITLTPQEAWSSLPLWLALHEPDLMDLSVRGETARLPQAPFLIGKDTPEPWRLALGVITVDGMAFFVRAPQARPLPDSFSALPPPFELFVRGYGQAGTAVARLQQHLHHWEAAGRPAAPGLRVRACSLLGAPPAAAHISRRWHRFLVDWPNRE